jgi:hypothetical protein
MIELDDVWRQMLDDAAHKAVNAGRADIADYFRLRAANDAVRAAGAKWLFDVVIEAAAEAQRRLPRIDIEKVDGHRFAVGNSTMVGSVINVRLGLRCFSAEAGWVRLPGDGIMRGGALVHAAFRHFGFPRETAELSLVPADPTPQWVDATGQRLTTYTVAEHVFKLTQDISG